ncbi:uncharacterized protein EI97DRAFT_435032 [Westerdykella ornata]|uniref:Capsule polysaccharide biosynthesis protein n=1 Tax=Westerdykella ornata TaxID=318751 RepID=A0A6A6JFT2_WESOR|nr:uncharacterized protein EI97DRAFT_435032 [Westerdykella ornata]KAF2274486.1 hypothetical protein EI97DRAFT_435032 [Westerdykella ornata]
MAAMSTPALASAISAAATSILAFLSQRLQSALSACTDFSGKAGIWKAIAILLALANLKMLPGMWHIRFFTSFFYQLHYQPTRIPPSALFQPIITSTRCTALETDYNIHKSNSTYFADMDISRTHLFTAIIRRAIQKSAGKGGAFPRAAGATEGTKGPHIIALGGISCLFKKEIKPYAKYEMWTRLLCWDKKWFYLVTHLVRPGVGKPKEWTLQPWKKGARPDQEYDAEKLKGAIFATAIAKYVVKEGRRTIAPELVLLDAGMVPAKPEGWVYKGEVEATADGDIVIPEKEDAESWNWDVIERQRLKGLSFAENFVALDGLHDVFDGGKNGALGRYIDL